MGILNHSKDGKERAVHDRHFSRSDALIRHAGHYLVKDAGNKQRCLRCGQSWYKRQRLAMFSLGECPGPKIWGIWPREPRAPWPAPRGSDFIHLGQIMHPSHVFRWHRGILWCQKCGCLSYLKAGLLSPPCRLKAINSYQRNHLKCIASDKCPLKGRKPWPLPPGTSSPYAAFLT